MRLKIKNWKRKGIMLMAVLGIVIGSVQPANAAEPESYETEVTEENTYIDEYINLARNAVIRTCSASLAISSGKATCNGTGSAYASMASSTKITMYLQKYGSGWSNVTSWTTTSTSTAILSKTYSVPSGTYQVKVVFIHQMDGSINRISVSRGLHFVKQDLTKRMHDFKTEERFNYFFTKENEPNQNFYELMEFWEVSKDCLFALRKKERNTYSAIFELIYEMDGHYHYFQYEKLIAHMGTDFENSLEELCLRIEEIYNNKFIKILDSKMTEKCQISLGEFEKAIGGFEYGFVRLWLANTMFQGGIAQEKKTGITKPV